MSGKTYRGLLVTGTDTGIGKTVVSAMLVQALGATYFKPVQAGLDEETDTEFVKRVTGLPNSRIIEESYRLNTPASPHLAAQVDGLEIDPDRLALPESASPRVVEGAGGAMVPLTPNLLFVEIFSRWQLPAVICARTSLGTINHTLLTVEALRQRSVPVLGIVFVGDHHQENETIIPRLGEVVGLGRLPYLESIDAASLQAAFEQNFKLEQFTEILT